MHSNENGSQNGWQDSALRPKAPFSVRHSDSDFLFRDSSALIKDLYSLWCCPEEVGNRPLNSDLKFYGEVSALFFRVVVVAARSHGASLSHLARDCCASRWQTHASSALEWDMQGTRRGAPSHRRARWRETSFYFNAHSCSSMMTTMMTIKDILFNTTP